MTLQVLTHWGRVTHLCVSKLTTIGSDNGLSLGRRQAIIRANAEILLIEPLGTNFSEILIETHTFSFKKIRLKMSPGKRQPFCLGLNVLTPLLLSMNIPGDLGQYHGCWCPGSLRRQVISSMVLITQDKWVTAFHEVWFQLPLSSQELTLNVRGPSYLGLTRSISWLLMPWLLTSPGHQQPWYWLCRVCRSWPYLRKDFKYLCHINAE